MSNSAALLKSVETKVDAAIKSSRDHIKVLTGATVAAFLFFTEHGQNGPLNRLINNVSATDQEGIRLFAVNIIRTFAVDKDAKNSYFKYSKNDKFTLASFKDDEKERLQHSKDMKKAVIKAGEEGLAKIPLGKLDTDNDTLENMFNTSKVVGDFIKRLVKNGEKALALQFNRAAGDYAVNTGELEKLAESNDPAKQLAEAKKRVAALEAKAARINPTPAIVAEEKQPAGNV